MSRELRICPGVGGWKCGAFLSSLDRDPHPTCARCRGKICTRDLTCDFCVGWSPAQWKLFAKKRTYKECKDLALQALFPLRRGLRPARELLRKFRSPGLPPPPLLAETALDVTGRGLLLVGLRRSGNFSPRNELTKNVKDLTLQALLPLRRGLRPARELLR